MNEIHANDTPEFKNNDVNGFKDIKPEGDMDAGKAKSFWDDLFSGLEKENADNISKADADEMKKNETEPSIDAVPHNFNNDITGKRNDIENRQGNREFTGEADKNSKSDVEYNRSEGLKPNDIIENNGFTYTTDNQGRVISAYGELKVTENTNPRNMSAMQDIGHGDQKDTDQRGHLIAHRFGAGDGIENLVPMDAGLNQGDYKKLENKLADAVDSGCKVSMKVEPVYKDDSFRPSEFKVTSIIDGEKEITVFKNESKE